MGITGKSGKRLIRPAVGAMAVYFDRLVEITELDNYGRTRTVKHTDAGGRVRLIPVQVDLEGLWYHRRAALRPRGSGRDVE